MNDHIANDTIDNTFGANELCEMMKPLEQQAEVFWKEWERIQNSLEDQACSIWRTVSDTEELDERCDEHYALLQSNCAWYCERRQEIFDKFANEALQHGLDDKEISEIIEEYKEQSFAIAKMEAELDGKY